MREHRIGALRAGVLILLPFVLAACALPRAGPYYEEITDVQDEDQPAFDLINVDYEISEIVNADEGLSFDLAFVEAAPERATILGVGDVLSVTIWERVENGLFGVGGVSMINGIIVEDNGTIFLPYVGRVRASGKSVAGLRNTIRSLIEDQTLDPQVEVRREVADSKSVTITGSAGAAGVVPIEPTTTRLLPLLAKAGIATEDPASIRVRVRRKELEGEIWLEDLYANPRYDIPLRAGDTIFLDRDTRYFTALGSSSQSRINFPTRDISALDAIALMGGLNSSASDPSGIFIFREESPEVADALNSERTEFGPRKVAYILDLTKPDGFFIAESFKMRDKDLIYVTDAPFTRFQKIASAFSSVIGVAGAASSITGASLTGN